MEGKGHVLKPRNVIESLSLKFWRTHFSYFPITVRLPPSGLSTSKQYVFGVHPHGIHCWALNVFSIPGGPLDVLTSLTSEGCLTGLAASVIFWIPVVRELFLQMGYVDAGRVVAGRAMDRGRSLFICTGGEEESMRTKVGEDVVVLNKRKGFVRLAVSHGADLVPVFGFGISDLYSTYSLGMGVRMWIQKTTGVALPFFHGRFLSPLPYKVPVRVVVGEVIKIEEGDVPEKGVRPDEKVVEKYHRMYVESLKRMHK
eukprot:CAMPEP_0118640848 /NCGR_PEP_ID=MMETSP0785-20121206/4967_1 /TAXON_ID=91992 /ORGANISM="Bolidomonas pacifica, Strain CCMP 1866" /LENGTH=255 /DNA_ID=CAMNT_0006532253 /DNA_START=351 /DNA_END=1115 /DNA_ORIENTATION=+